MRKISTLLAGTVIAGALTAGLAAAPASATTTTATAAAAAVATAATASAAQAQFGRHRFGPFYESYGRGENRNHASYYDGYWYTSNGRTYFDFTTYDRDRDRQSTRIDIQVHDDRGWHDYRSYRTSGHRSWKRVGGFDTDRYDGFRFRVGEGDSRDWDYSRWYTQSW
jgi:hypothetical protein